MRGDTFDRVLYRLSRIGNFWLPVLPDDVDPGLPMATSYARRTFRRPVDNRVQSLGIDLKAEEVALRSRRSHLRTLFFLRCAFRPGFEVLADRRRATVDDPAPNFVTIGLEVAFDVVGGVVVRQEPWVSARPHAWSYRVVRGHGVVYRGATLIHVALTSHEVMELAAEPVVTVCGYGPAYCGSGNCTLNCNAVAECGLAERQVIVVAVCGISPCHTLPEITDIVHKAGSQSNCVFDPHPPNKVTSTSIVQNKVIGYYESWSDFVSIRGWSEPSRNGIAISMVMILWTSLVDGNGTGFDPNTGAAERRLRRSTDDHGHPLECQFLTNRTRRCGVSSRSCECESCRHMTFLFSKQ
nr:hypothetical protein CFP56_78283 [Quercus suber]